VHAFRKAALAFETGQNDCLCLLSAATNGESVATDESTLRYAEKISVASLAPTNGTTL